MAAAHDGITAMVLDVTNPDDVAAVAEIEVDVLVNNAGRGLMAPLTNVELDEVRKTFDVNKLQWIGNITNDVTVLTVWNASTKARTVEDARKMEIIIGGTSPTGLSNLIPKAMNYALGTKFKVVTGYKGGLGVDQDLPRSGGVDGDVLDVELTRGRVEDGSFHDAPDEVD